jgi:hypothetical protein
MVEARGNGGTPTRRCPNCGKPPEKATFPFCSARCKLVDLARWFGEDYKIPVVETDDDFEEMDEPGDEPSERSPPDPEDEP